MKPLKETCPKCDGAMDIADELQRVVSLKGDTYSSAEVIGICARAASELGRLRTRVKIVVEAFENDEAQGYRSRDRQFAISILKPPPLKGHENR